MTFTEALAARVLLCDGAMGTLARASGVRADGPGAELCVVAPELVAALHRRYVAAGADVLQTHTYEASRPRLARHGLAARVGEINRAGARIAAAVRDAADTPAWVAGSVSPAAPARNGTASAAEVHAAVREQVEALVEGGVDLLVLETFTGAGELADAVAAAREVTDLPVVGQVTFVDDDGSPVTAAGESPAQVLATLADVPLAAVGTNCTLGPQGLLGVVRRMAGHTELPLAAQPNAGLPHVVADRSVHYAADTEHFARYVARYVAAGARLVGGCCGTTPEHTAAAARALAATPAPPPAPPPEAGREAVAVTAGPAGTPAGRGRVERWLRARARDPLVVVELARPGPPDAALDRARRAAGAGADAVWVGRPREALAPATAGTPAGTAVHLTEHVDVDTAVTVTCWDASVVGLQADLLGLHALGVRTIVCETGNPPVLAEAPVRDGSWEVDAPGLLRVAAGLNRGVDVDGAELGTATAFRVGARVTPGAHDLDREVRRAGEKIAAGAEFLITRPVYEPARLAELLAALGGDVPPVLLLVEPLVDFAHAEHLRHEVPGVVLPDAVLDRMRAASGPADAGLDLAEELVRAAAPLVDGVVVRWSGPAALAAVPRLRAVLASGRRARRSAAAELRRRR